MPKSPGLALSKNHILGTERLSCAIWKWGEWVLPASSHPEPPPSLQEIAVIYKVPLNGLRTSVEGRGLLGRRYLGLWALCWDWRGGKSPIFGLLHGTSCAGPAGSFPGLVSYFELHRRQKFWTMSKIT